MSLWTCPCSIPWHAHAPAPRGYRDQYRTHSRPSRCCVERETGLVAGWRCTVCPAFAVTAGTLAPVQHDASCWSAVAQLPGAMRMYLYTLRAANCQYRTLAISEALCSGADASRAARRVGRPWGESASSRKAISWVNSAPAQIMCCTS